MTPSVHSNHLLRNKHMHKAQTSNHLHSQPLSKTASSLEFNVDSKTTQTKQRPSPSGKWPGPNFLIDCSFHLSLVSLLHGLVHFDLGLSSRLGQELQLVELKPPIRFAQVFVGRLKSVSQHVANNDNALSVFSFNNHTINRLRLMLVRLLCFPSKTRCSSPICSFNTMKLFVAESIPPPSPPPSCLSHGPLPATVCACTCTLRTHSLYSSLLCPPVATRLRTTTPPPALHTQRHEEVFHKLKLCGVRLAKIDRAQQPFNDTEDIRRKSTSICTASFTLHPVRPNQGDPSICPYSQETDNNVSQDPLPHCLTSGSFADSHRPSPSEHPCMLPLSRLPREIVSQGKCWRE